MSKLEIKNYSTKLTEKQQKYQHYFIYHKQILKTDQKSISNFFSKDFLAAGIRDELNKIKEIEQEINRDDLI